MAASEGASVSEGDVETAVRVLTAAREREDEPMYAAMYADTIARLREAPPEADAEEGGR